MFTVRCCRGNPGGLFDFHLSAPPPTLLLAAVWSQALSTCEREGYTNRPGLYILCVCSVFPAGCFEEHVCFCDFFFFFLALLCHVLRFICSSFFFLVLSSRAYAMLVNTGSRKWEQPGNLIDHGHITEKYTCIRML